MRAKCVGPARLDAQLQCDQKVDKRLTTHIYAMCALYNVHKEYLFCTQVLCISKYNSLANVQRIDYTQYRINICCMLCVTVKCLVY